MLDYFLKVLLFQTLFLVLYDFILQKETFFQWNRAYLIVTSLLCYVIPLVQIQEVANSIPQESLIWLPEVVLSPQKVIESSVDWSVLIFSVLKWVFFTGVLISLTFFTIKLTRLLITIRKNEKEKRHYYSLVFLKDTSAFSFFNYIFLGNKISKEKKQQIIDHELIHVQQKHSIDLLFFELQKIVFWFNPYSYLYQKRVSELHEFIADAKSVKNKTNYFQNLLAETFGTDKISFINHFFKHSLIKKRIVMLNKAKSKSVLKFKYLLMLPLLVGMLIYSSCTNESDPYAKEVVTKNTKQKEVTEVDPENVPFAVVEEAPIFPGCESENTKECFNKSIQKFVGDNFDKKIGDNLNLKSGRVKIYVKFKIDKNGNAVEVKSRAPHPDLQKYAVDLIEKLPQMSPGKYKGETVNVMYMLPIAFDVK